MAQGVPSCTWDARHLVDGRPRRLGLPDLEDWPLRALVFSD